jgi:hypothetical protein
MTHVFERVFLHCPYVRARQYLTEALEKTTEERVPFSIAGGALDATVAVYYERARDPLHFDEPWHVFWTPESAGPYPDFAGEITVRADEDYHDAVMEISGDYAPPLGAVGKAFDLVLGGKIASATSRSLLHRIGGAMEARYRVETSAQRRQSA